MGRCLPVSVRTYRERPETVSAWPLTCVFTVRSEWTSAALAAELALVGGRAVRAANLGTVPAGVVAGRVGVHLVLALEGLTESALDIVVLVGGGCGVLAAVTCVFVGLGRLVGLGAGSFLGHLDLQISIFPYPGTPCCIRGLHRHRELTAMSGAARIGH